MPTRLLFGEGPSGWGSNRRAHPFRSTGVMGTARWNGGAGNRGRSVVVGVVNVDAVASAADLTEVGEGHSTDEAG